MARVYGGAGRIKDKADLPALRAHLAQQMAKGAGGRPLHGAARNQALISAMAEEIVARAVANDNCTKADLLQTGFAEADIDAFGPRAVARARLIAPNLRVA